ncbi:MAG: hypothetical protein WKF58_14120 [Ilumatobacteraceae bacterium]
MPGADDCLVDRGDRWILAGVAMGIGVRVAMLIARLGDAVPFSDTLWYTAQAKALRKGRGFDDLFTGDPTAEHGPLTPILLSPATTADGQRALMALYGVVGLLVLVVVARRLLSPLAARGCLRCSAVPQHLDARERPHVRSARDRARQHDDPVHARRSRARSMVGGGRARHRHRSRRARPQRACNACPLCALVVWRHSPGRRLMNAGVVLVAALVVVAPWVALNLSRFDEPTFLTTNDGTTWIGANCDDTYSGGNTGSWTVFCAIDVEGLDDDADASVRSARQRELAFEYISEHAERVPVVVVARLARTLDLYGVSNMISGDVGEDKFEWVAWLGVVSFWVLAPLTVVGLRAMGRRDRALVLPVMVTVLVTTVVFYGAHRIRAPLEPAVVLASAVGVSSLVDRWRSRPRGRGAPAVPARST